MTEKADKPEKPEPTPGTRAQSFGDAPAEMGFLPLDNPPPEDRRAIRQGRQAAEAREIAQ